MDSTFFDILGILIAFVTIILLLSMVVTGLVQVIQSLFRFRSRNLLRGLISVFQEVRGDNKSDAKENARRLLNSPSVALLGHYENPLGRITKLIGPHVSWLEPDQLEEALKDSEVPKKDDERKIQKRFEQIQRPLEKRFLRMIRIWTVIVSLLVAVYFQVSTPSLLSKLSTDAQWRAQVLNATGTVLQQTESALQKLAKYEDVTEIALVQLAEAHPDIAIALEEAGGQGTTKQDLLNEVELILEDHPQKQEISAEYSKILDNLLMEKRNESQEVVDDMLQQLAYLDIEPWPNDMSFYISSGRPKLGNWIGVLITTVLLSLGAPFWFNILKDLVNLKEALKPKEKKKSPYLKTW